MQAASSTVSRTGRHWQVSDTARRVPGPGASGQAENSLRHWHWQGLRAQVRGLGRLHASSVTSVRACAHDAQLLNCGANPAWPAQGPHIRVRYRAASRSAPSQDTRKCWDAWSHQRTVAVRRGKGNQSVLGREPGESMLMIRITKFPAISSQTRGSRCLHGCTAQLTKRCDDQLFDRIR